MVKLEQRRNLQTTYWLFRRKLLSNENKLARIVRDGFKFKFPSRNPDAPTSVYYHILICIDKLSLESHLRYSS